MRLAGTRVCSHLGDPRICSRAVCREKIPKSRPKDAQYAENRENRRPTKLVTHVWGETQTNYGPGVHAGIDESKRPRSLHARNPAYIGARKESAVGMEPLQVIGPPQAGEVLIRERNRRFAADRLISKAHSPA